MNTDPRFASLWENRNIPLENRRLDLTLQPDKWEIASKNVFFETSIGEGAFGVVSKGIIRGPIVNSKVRMTVKQSFCTPVAIKTLKSKKIFS